MLIKAKGLELLLSIAAIDLDLKFEKLMWILGSWIKALPPGWPQMGFGKSL